MTKKVSTKDNPAPRQSTGADCPEPEPKERREDRDPRIKRPRNPRKKPI